jgi:autotransporter-associated beta strand protein
LAEVEQHYDVGVANGELSMDGVGTLTLSGANTYTGDTVVNSGNVVVGSSAALGSTAGETVVNTNGTLVLPGGVTTGAEPITLIGTPMVVNQAGANTLGGPITLLAGATPTFEVTGGSLDLDGSLTGATGPDLGAAILSGQGAGGNLDLLEVGGGPVSNNVALDSRGAVAFAKDVLNSPSHSITGVNDGRYGNFGSWIAGSANSYVGVTLANATSIDAIAFGRSNVTSGDPCGVGVCTDRSLGTYTFQFTTDPALDSANPEGVTWQTIDAVTYNGVTPDNTPHRRHLWSFDQVEDVTGVRIMTSANGIDIDELEVHAPVSVVTKTGAGSLTANGDVELSRYNAQAGDTTINGTVSIPASGMTVIGPADVAVNGIVEDAPYSSAVESDVPVGFWRLGEAVGTVAENSGRGGAALDGTYVNIAALGAPGLVADGDTAADFNGIQNGSGSFVEVSGLDSVAGGNPFENDWTIEAWFVRDSQNQWSGVASNNFDNAAADTGRQGPLMTFIDNSQRIGINGAGVTANNVSIDIGAASLGEQVYAVITKTGGNANSTASITVHANVGGVWQPMATGTNSGWDLLANDGFYLGRHWTAGNQKHDGLIDEVAIYDRALSLVEVEQHYDVGVAQANGELTMDGTGTLTLSGVNTYTGDTVVNSGTVVVGSSAALGSTVGETTVNTDGTLAFPGGVTLDAEAIALDGTATVDNQAGTNTITGSITLATAATPTFNVIGGPLDVDGSVSGLGTLVKDGAGDLQIDGDVEIDTIDTQLGLITINGATSIPATGLTVTGPADVVVTGVVEDAPYSSAVLVDDPIGFWRLGEASGTVADNIGSGGSALDGTYVNIGALGAPGLVDDGDTAADFNGIQNGSGSFVEVSGLDSVAGGNPFENDWTIEAWFVRDSQNQWSGVASNNFDNAAADTGRQGPLMTFIDNSQRIGINGAGVTANNVSIDIGAASLGEQVYAVITKTGGNANSTANITVHANVGGVWQPMATGTNSGWDLLANDGFYLGRHWTAGNQKHDGLIDEVAIYDRALSLAEVEQHYDVGVANGELSMDGVGNLTLSGANTYVGETTVSGGTILATNTSGSATSGGDVTIQSSATLSGNGTVSGDVNVEAGGSVAPGTVAPAIGPAILSTGNVNFATGSSFDVELNGTTAGPDPGGYDQLNVAGTVDLDSDTSDGATLNTTAGFTTSNGDTFVIVDNDGTDAISNTFNNLTEGDGILVNNRTLAITYVYDADTSSLTGGNDVALIDDTPVVEFSSATYTINEDDVSGTATITLTRSGSTSFASDVQVTITASTATGGGADFTFTPDPLTVSFGSGETSKDIDFAIVADAIVELDETIDFQVSSVSNVDIGTQSTTQMTITNDESATISIAAISQTETDASTTFSFDVSLSAIVDVAVDVAYDTAAGATNPATVGTDYQAASGTLNFLANTTAPQTLQIDVTVLGEDLAELDEEFVVNLLSIAATGRDVTFVGAGATETVTGTIQNDDFTPVPSHGGAYAGGEASTIQIDASGTTDGDTAVNTLSYLWDLDGDGTFGETGAINAPFGDEIGTMPTFTDPEAGATPTVHNIVLRVSDGTNTAADINTTVTVSNVAPTAGLTGPSLVIPSLEFDFTVLAADPSIADTAAGFTWEIDWDYNTTTMAFDVDESVVGSSSQTVPHEFDTLGNFTVAARAIDRDGGVGGVVILPVAVSPVAVIDGDVVVGGTTGRDRIIVSDGGGGHILVRLNNRFFDVVPDVSGIVRIGGGDHNDTISISGNLNRASMIDAGVGNDYVAGGRNDDTISGGLGNDTLIAGGGNNLVFGGEGNDRITARGGNDVFFGESGNDRLQGGSGNDTLDGGAGNDQLVGGNGADLLIGGADRDILAGNRGNDILLGGEDVDRLTGNDGFDLLIGGLGADGLRGSRGNDILIGGTTNYDLDSVVLRQILVEWADGSHADLDARIDAIDQFATPLNTTTVNDDGEVNGLSGGGGPDVIFHGIAEVVGILTGVDRLILL